MKKTSEFRDQSLEELNAVLEESRKEIFELRNQSGATKKLEKPHLIRHKRKEVARVLTVMREKQK